MKPHIGVAGAGFAGAVLARELAESGKFRVTVFEERNHVAGNCHTERDEETGIMIHQYGPKVFHTQREDVWEYVNRWGKFEPFELRVKAQTARGMFSFPINLLTINQFFGKCLKPSEARDFLGSLNEDSIRSPSNFEDHATKYLGKELYQNFLQGLVKKSWGRAPSELPLSTTEPLVRLNYNDNFYAQRFQGMPLSGYTEIVKRILDHYEIDLRLGTKLEPERKRDFDHLFWSGPMDGFYQYELGRLGYRNLTYERFEEVGDYQGTPVIHFCEEEIPFTRIIEHKHFAPWEFHEKTVCYKEYSRECGVNDLPSFPLRREEDLSMLKAYVSLMEKEDKVTFLGGLGTYRDLEMHEAIAESLDLVQICLDREPGLWPRFSHHPLS